MAVTDTDTEIARPAQGGGRMLLMVCGAAVVLLVVALCVNATRANDLFWQMRTGQEILANGRLPHVDGYSWTRHGAPWVVRDWLSCVLFAEAYRRAHGFAGVWMLEAAVLAAAFLVLFAAISGETGRAPITAFLLTALAAVGASGFFQPRPQIFTYLFVAVTMGLAGRARGRPRAPRSTWALVPMTALWANLHSGALIGAGMVAVFAASEALAAARRAKDDPVRPVQTAAAGQLAAIAAACAAATLATPHGWLYYRDFWQAFGAAAPSDVVSEWGSPNFHTLSGKVLEPMLAAVMIGVIATRRARDPVEVLAIVTAAHAALSANGNVPLFALIAVPLAARHIQSMLSGHADPPDRLRRGAGLLFGGRPAPAAVLAVCAAFVLAAAAAAGGVLRLAPETAKGPVERIARVSISLAAYPENACAFLAAQAPPVRTRLYNVYGDGGFLIWRLPRQAVFIDSRTDVYAGRLLGDYARIKKLPGNYWSLLAPYAPDVVLCAATDSQSKLFFGSPDWALVYADSSVLDAPAVPARGVRNSLVFMRRAQAGDAISRWRAACPVVAQIAGQERYANWAAVR